MTAPILAPAPPVWVLFDRADAGPGADALSLASQAGLTLAPNASPDVVLLAVVGAVESAADLRGAAWLASRRRLLVVADVLSAPGVLRAVRAGVRTMLARPGASPAQLADAVRSAYHGDGRLPYSVLTGILSCPAGASPRAQPSLLTTRQLAVLELIAEGHSNTAIARALSCSEHTVKNFVYDLMTRLEARTRAHAVALAFRAGLI